MDKENVTYICTRVCTHTHACAQTWNITQPLKKPNKQENLALCDNMKEPGEYYAERNKPDIEK